MSFEAAHLPDFEKENLCRSLLAEFGVTRIKRGGEGELIHQCCLPFGGHSDGNSESASLNWQKLTYNCFVCGNSGGLLWFIGVCRDISGGQARQWLDQQTGFGADEASLSALLQFFDSVYGDDRRYRPPPIPRLDARVLNQWLCIHPYLTDPRPEGREIPEANLMAFKVGYGELNVNVGDGVKVPSHRIIIPHFWRGNLTGWQSRRLVKDGTAKYLSTPDLPKDQTIFNYEERAPVVVVVESPMSVISKHHLAHFEGTFGASVTDRQIRLLSNHQKVILWFDNDEAGWKATEHVGDALMAYSDVWVVNSDWAADTADFTDEMATDLLANAVPYAIWTRPEELRVPEWLVKEGAEA